MRIAITGGTGFVGGHLATVLAAAGHDVVVLARGADRRPRAQEVLGRPGVTLVRASVVKGLARPGMPKPSRS
jgi:nucleoside-diphosphate-sugar epimerase